MLKLHLQLSSQRKRLYQEAIRRLQHVCVCDEGSPDGRIVGPEDISGEHPIPCLVDQPEKIAEDHLMARLQDGLRIMPAHEWRFRPKILPMHAALLEEKLGKPGLLRLHQWFAPEDCLRQRMMGALDLARFFFGGLPVLHHSIQQSQSLLCHLQFASGGMALLHVCQLPQGTEAYESIHLIGATGAVYGDDHHNTHLHFKPGHLAARMHHDDVVSGLSAMIAEFAAGVAERRSWSVSITDTLRAAQQLKDIVDG